jgi:hypothetical protein
MSGAVAVNISGVLERAIQRNSGRINNCPSIVTAIDFIASPA